jgi:hypothetical protein
MHNFNWNRKGGKPFNMRSLPPKCQVTNDLRLFLYSSLSSSQRHLIISALLISCKPFINGFLVVIYVIFSCFYFVGCRLIAKIKNKGILVRCVALKYLL